MSEHVFDKYMRQDKLPHMWCPGCGNGIVLQAIIRAIEKSGVDKKDVVIVDGIGCSSRANSYTNVCGIQANHGRAIAFATGIKMHNPNLHIVVITGDGDCTSIGGNHFIHGCRRNIDMTVVVFNNSNYGMTGGQFSPVTPPNSFTKTSVYGSIDPNFNISELAAVAGASYVARWTTYHAAQLSNAICKGILHKGFSVIEAACDCPSLFGRINKRGSAADMLLRWKEVAVPVEKAKSMSAEELKGKIVVGEFACRDDRAEYTEAYDTIIAKANGGKQT